VTGPIVVGRYRGPEAAGPLDALLPLYEEIYAEPPYREGPREIAEFLDRTERQVGHRGFRLVTASAGAQIVGFSFGYPLPADTRWWAALLEPVPPDVTRETGQRSFAIIELAVRASLRRRGIAARLHAALLADLGVQRVTLTVRPEPEAAPARSAYAAWGYRKIGRTQPWDGAPVYDALVLDLAPRL
jgi:ribosomal protein S18 acetylase RimI-like enzyme